CCATATARVSATTNTRSVSMLQPASDYEPRHDLMEVPPPPPAGAQQLRGVDLREMTRILRRRRWIVILTTGVFVALAIAFVAIVTPRYTATSTVLIDQHRSSVADSNSNPPPPPKFGTEDSIVDSQVLLIQSDAVLQRVVDQLNLTKDPEFGPHPGWLDPIKALFPKPTPGQSAEDITKAQTVEYLQKRLKVTREGTTYVIDINVSSESPTKAAKIANAVADSYFYQEVQSKYDTNKIAASWLNKQIDDLKSRVLASDRAVAEFRATHNLTTAQGVTINEQQLADLNNNLIDAHVKTAEARAKFEQVQKIAQSHGDPGSIAQALTSDVITRLRTQYAEVAKNLADASSKFGPQHPLVVNAKAQLRETQRLINEEVKRILTSTRQAYDVAK